MPVIGNSIKNTALFTVQIVVLELLCIALWVRELDERETGSDNGHMLSQMKNEAGFFPRVSS